jgi:hypothetical protein
MPLDEQDLQMGRSAGQHYFSPSKQIEVGSFVEIEVTDISKQEGVKFPIAGKTWAYACTLSDGRVWNVNSKSLYGPLLRYGYPDGKKFAPFKVRLHRLARKAINDPGYRADKI